MYNKPTIIKSINPKGKRMGLYITLLSEIQTGKYSEGDLIPTEEELAASFSVSRSTINRILQRLKGEGYLIRKPGYGTIVKSINLHKNKKIGLIVPGLNNTEIFEPICKTISEYAHDFNFSIYWNERKLSTLNPNIQKEIDTICTNYIHEGIEGVLFSPLSRVPNMTDINTRIIERFLENDIRIVLLDRDIVPWPQRSNLDLVSNDNINAGFIMARHLLESGSRRIIFLVPEKSADPAYQRYIGALKAVEEMQDFSISMELINLPVETINIIEFLKDVTQADSIICSNDTVAARVFQSCLTNKLRVPEDIRLAGFDDINYAKNLGVPLTSYAQPFREIAIGALDLMKSRLSDIKKAPRSLYIIGSLTIRDSTIKLK